MGSRHRLVCVWPEKVARRPSRQELLEGLRESMEVHPTVKNMLWKIYRRAEYKVWISGDYLENGPWKPTALRLPPMNTLRVLPTRPQMRRKYSHPTRGTRPTPAEPVAPVEATTPPVDQAGINAALLHGLLDIRTLLENVIGQQGQGNPAAPGHGNPAAPGQPVAPGHGNPAAPEQPVVPMETLPR
ncbi:unnamed protein product [Arabis nemorensis]|uniref:Uncharacterized protein n=1 Tax=Arabis nemorensis TaxID=586526 RepID=A0A565AWU5_9BRAS|nr:unnamed protein product [Arabis nemorensis]